MKAQKINNTTLKTKGIKDTVSFGIKESGLAHIFNVLRNQLYTDKILAVVREYVANAIDANVDAGKRNIPVEVTLPTRLDLHFKVRDFGRALTQSDIHEIYAMYGESTKRNTNDQIGMLGIGSKSAFAYGDNFVINSFVNGRKHSYNAFIDPSQVGQIAKLSELPTDEPDGLEIVVPVQEDDVDEFQDKAYDMFKLFKIKPKVLGGNPESFKRAEEDERTLFSGDDWEYLLNQDQRDYNGYHSNNGAVAIMGNIGYPINARSLGNISDSLSELVNSELRIEFPIGDLEIAANREGLQYTDYTKKNLINKLEKVRDEMGDKIVEKFSGCKTLWETKQLYHSMFDLSSNLYNIRKIISDRLQFNGITVKNNSIKRITQKDDDEMLVFKLEKARTKYHWTNHWSIQAQDNTVIVHNDLGHRRGALAKVLPIKLEDEKDVYIVSWKDDAAYKHFVKETGFDAPMLKMSELPKRDISKWGYGYQGSNGRSYTQNPQNLKKVLELDVDGDHETDGRSFASSWKETKADIVDGSGVFVLIDKYKMEIDGRYTPIKPIDFVEYVIPNLEKLGIEIPKLIGVKPSMAEKINLNNWTNIVDYVSDSLRTVIKDNNMSELHHQREDFKNIEGNMLAIVKYLKEKGKLDFSEGVASKLADLAEPVDYEAKLSFGSDLKLKQFYNAINAIKKWLEVDAESMFDKRSGNNELIKVHKEAQKVYPMLELADTWGWKNKDAYKKAYAQYVNLVDLNNIPAMLS